MGLSTTKVEYMATTEGIKEVVWLKRLLQELRLLQEKVMVYPNSQSAIHLCKNPVFYERSKHISIKYHFII